MTGKKQACQYDDSKGRNDGRCWVNSPVKPTSDTTVILCAESNTRLPVSMTLSNLDTCAAFALSWAARSLATFCSGVSRSGDGPPLLPPADAGETGADLGAVKRGGGAAAVLELACGVVAVKRVASETLRGAADTGIVLSGC